MHTDPIWNKPEKPTIGVPNKLLLKPVVKLERVNVLPGMVVQVKDYFRKQTNDEPYPGGQSH